MEAENRLLRKAGKNNKTSSKITLPLGWLGKDVIVSLKGEEPKLKEEVISKKEVKKSVPIEKPKQDNELCPYYSNTGNPICKAGSVLTPAYECDGLLIKCPKKA